MTYSLATPLTPSPTERSVLGSPHRLSPTNTLVNGFASQQDTTDPTAGVFAVHDWLIGNSSANLELPWTNIVSIGGQSAGKSSVLSSLSGIPLWTAQRTATHGPTQIHSRRRPGAPFEASIQVLLRNQRDAQPRSVHFTEHAIRSPDKLAEIMRLAGDEARRVRSGFPNFRTYEKVIHMTTEEREMDKEHWDRFTENVVVLHVSGADQRNVSIVDLPGLMGGVYGEFINGLANECLSKPENLLMLCLPAGGPDASSDAPEVRLVMKHRPTGARTIGLVTKADQIEDPAENAFTDLILNRNKDWSWWPEFGWHPFRGKHQNEARDNVSDTVVRMRQEALFQRSDWQEIAKQGQTKFGVDSLCQTVYDIFESLVVGAVSSLREHLDAQYAVLAGKLSALPASEQRPIGALHDLIIAISQDLVEHLDERAKYHDQLLNLQLDLRKKIFSTVPGFIPFLEDDEGRCETVEPVWLASWSERDECEGKGVYLDAVVEAVKGWTRARDGTRRTKSIRLDLLRRYVAGWDAICEGYVKDLWRVVDAAVDEVITLQCGDKVALAQCIKQLLRVQQEMCKTNTLETISRICALERTDPYQIDYKDDEMSADVDAVIKSFTDAYEQLCASHGGEDTDEPKTCRLDPKLRHGVYTVIADVLVNLVQGSKRVTRSAGRGAQNQLFEYLRSVVPTLRAGLGLEDVDEPLRKRARTFFEGDPAATRQREALLAQQADLDRVAAQLRAYIL